MPRFIKVYQTAWLEALNLVAGHSEAIMGAVVVKNGQLGSTLTREGGGALNLALGDVAKANSGAVVLKIVSFGGAHVYSGSQLKVDDAESSPSFGAIVNIAATGGHEYNKNSVIVK